MFDYLKKQYELGKIDDDYLHKMVSKGIITDAELEAIILIGEA